MLRGNTPKRKFTRHNYRKARLSLEKDFEQRCAYSRIHIADAGGPRAFQVDHFNPKLKQGTRHRYANLMLACVHCNLEKSDSWPNKAEIRSGVRLLDCTKEQDYGPHIVEDRNTGLLHGRTPAGDFHITVLGLNDPYFVGKRRDRTSLLRLTRSNLVISGNIYSQLIEDVRTAVQVLSNMIPELPEL